LTGGEKQFAAACIEIEKPDGCIHTDEVVAKWATLVHGKHKLNRLTGAVLHNMQKQMLDMQQVSENFSNQFLPVRRNTAGDGLKSEPT